jgi:hypothetical protein
MRSYRGLQFVYSVSVTSIVVGLVVVHNLTTSTTQVTREQRVILNFTPRGELGSQG